MFDEPPVRATAAWRGGQVILPHPWVTGPVTLETVRDIWQVHVTARERTVRSAR